MATSNRDVKLTVEAQALGVDSIKNLAAQVRALGKDGGDAAPEFQRLAAELDQIADQSKAILGLRELSAQVTNLAAAQGLAATAADNAKSAYAGQKAATDALRETLAKSTDDWNTARRAQIAAREALDDLKLQTEALTAKEKARNSALGEAKTNLSQATAEQRRLKVALDEVSTALSAAAKLEREAAAEYRKTGAALGQRETALRASSGAFKDAETAAAKLGVETADLSAAEAGLRAVLVATAQAAEQQQRAVVKAAAALKAEADAAEKAAKVLAGVNRIRDEAYARDLAAKVKDHTAALKEEKAALERTADTLAKVNKLREDRASSKAAAALKAEADALANLEAKAREAKAALASAFDAVGVRSVQAIQSEITQTERAMTLLQQRFRAGEISAYDLSRATGAAEARMQALSAEIRRMPAAAGVFERMNASVLDLATRFGAVSAAMATVGYAAKPILDANLALDSMRRVLTTVYGSAEAAAEQIDFVRRVAEQSGLSVLTLGDSFTRFAASAKASGIGADTVRAVFQSTAAAAGNLGLSTDKTTHILDALSQMANKGTVSMEELRQQLGDSLPGALSLLAKGLGITEPQLVKLVESGKLLTSEALGPLAQAMTTLAAPGGRVEGLRAALARLGNEFTLTFQKISDTSAYKGLTATVGFLADNFSALTTGVKLFAEAIVVSKVATAVGNFLQLRAATTATAVATAEATAATVAGTAATAANTTATAANTAAKTANAVAAGAAAAANTGLAGSVVAAGAASAGATVGMGALAGVMARVTGAGRALFALIGGWPGVLITALFNVDLLAKGFVYLKDKVEAFLSPSDAARENFRGLERAAQSAAESVDASAESIVRAKVIYAEQAAALEKATAAAVKQAAAVKDLGEASIIAAEIAGNEEAKLLATTLARQQEADALARVAAAKQAEADLTAGLIAQVERSIEGKGRLGAVQQAELDQLLAKRDLLGILTTQEAEQLKSLQAQQAEAEKAISTTKEQIEQDKIKLKGQVAASEEAAAAAIKQRQLAAATQLAVDAARDNTSQYELFKQAAEGAALTLEFLRAEMRAGRATADQVAGATINLALANGRLKDSILDTARASEAWIRQRNAEGELTRAQLQITLEEQRSRLRTAELLGNETAATQAKIKIKEIELQLARKSVRVKADEANETIRATEQLRDELELAGQLTPEKRIELDLRILNAKAKAAEAKAGMEATKAIEAERDALKGLGAQKRAAPSPTSAPAPGAPPTAAPGAPPIAGIDGAGNSNPALQRDEFGRTAAQRKSLEGQGGPVDASYMFQLRDRLNRGDSFAASELPAIENALRVARENESLRNGSPVPDIAGARADAEWVEVLRRVRERAAGQGLGATPANAPPVAGGLQRTINVNLNGRTTSLNMASETDAEKLAAMFAELERAQSRTGG